jgi:sporulation protein YlmC with PRC-barrel domain
MQLSFGKPVKCQDGSFGELADVVVDPETMRLTHLITSPPGDAEARLIPIELARETDGNGDVTLHCTLAETEGLTSVREYHYLRTTEEPAGDEDWDLGVEHVLALPSDGGGLGLGAYEGVDASLNVSYDRVPKGFAELRHASSIVTADGGHYLGGIQSLHVDEGGRITDVVLDESHFWSRREITIPVEAVEALVTDTITVRLSPPEIAALPSTRVRRWF